MTFDPLNDAFFINFPTTSNFPDPLDEPSLRNNSVFASTMSIRTVISSYEGCSSNSNTNVGTNFNPSHPMDGS
eukprot:CAMPEP_0198294262 /NCGR_PEP_ID=MMETSP1449-20131203/21462_1 /TAXON_ID=420275 /ORGANISM="Attheya septentrionalis, Strain CCMP2084" /LENGTH=72 /DNA_ID=CAMNT_0043994157 /DNA_START=259 /DNA_END=477 /DNA_ORIENTATION=+